MGNVFDGGKYDSVGPLRGTVYMIHCSQCARLDHLIC